MGPMLIAGTVGLAATVAKIIDFFRLLSNFATQKSAVITQLGAFAAGIIGVELYAHSDYASGIVLGDIPLSTANGASLVLIGLAVSSFASLAVDFKQAIDHTDSAAKPPLIKSP